MQSTVSITFDDGLRCQFERAVPVLNKYGMPATFFLIANRNSTHDLWSGHVDDWCKIDWRPDDIRMLKQLLRDGHEIGSHSVSHHPTNLKTAEQSDFEARELKRLIEEWIGAPVASFCYPFYWSHAYLAEAVRKAGYQQARGGGVAPEYVPGSSYYGASDSGCFDRFNVDCRQISQNESVSEWLTTRLLARSNLSRYRRGPRWMGANQRRPILSGYGRTSQISRCRSRRGSYFCRGCGAIFATPRNSAGRNLSCDRFLVFLLSDFRLRVVAFSAPETPDALALLQELGPA